jgi:hypothetical protein
VLNRHQIHRDVTSCDYNKETYKELTRPSPRFPLFFSDGAVQGDTAPTLFVERPLVIFDLPSCDSDHLPDDSKPKVLTCKPKAVFQWPPDCLWPFIDHGIGKGYLTDVIGPLAISTLLKPIRQPSGTILTLSEVKRQVVVNALDKCGGNYLLAAHLLGIGKATI